MMHDAPDFRGSIRPLLARGISRPLGRLLLSLLILTVFSPAWLCAGEETSIPQKRALQPGIGDPQLEAQNYRLNANDILEIRVFQEEDLNTIARVNADGRISMPLIGSIKVSGRTVEESIQTIQAAYKNGFLVNPQVSILVNQYAQRNFTVLGQVGRPGNYSFEGGKSMNLLEAIGMAGGFTRLANTSRITIQRRVNGESTLTTVTAKSPGRGQGAPEIRIYPGDVITVHESLF